MKKGVILYVIYTLAIPALMMLASTCKSDNSLEDSLSSYDPILELARYISFNYSSGGSAKGVYTVSLSSTQAFDSYYWGWSWESETPQSMSSTSENTGSTDTDNTNSVVEYYLGSGDRTLSTIHTFNNLNSSDPSGPQYYHTHTGIPAFADGTFPATGATSGIIRPVPFETIKRTKYSLSGELAYDSELKTYSLTYDETTGLVSTYSILTQNNSTDSITLDIYGFSTDPRFYSSYYTSSYTKKTGFSNTLVGYVTTSIAVDNSSTPVETYTYQRFDENEELGSFTDGGDLGYLPSNFFADANGSTIVKIVKTITSYYSASGDIAANSVVTLVQKYSSATDVVFKEETVRQYESSQLSKIAAYQKKTYNVSGSTETQVSQDIKEYTDGYLVLDQDYLSSSGWTSPYSYIEYERDEQGRITSESRYDSNGLYYKDVYTFDSSGRTSTIRSYTVDTDSTETCNSTKNKDYSYETTSSGRQITETNYGCTSGELSPTTQYIRTYNASGQEIIAQSYVYSSSNFTLSSQSAKGYGSSGEQTYLQYYSIDGSGEATVSIRYEYTYDSNLFLTSTIRKDSSGEITQSYYVFTYTYQ